MKKLNKYIIIVLAGIALTVACNKDLDERTDNYAALNPTNSDTGAGNWKPILLTSKTEFAVDAPLATTSNDYKAEILEIKAWQQDMNSEKEAQLKYWGAGSVLRWNEIMRELVAKYNLAPYQNADGTYTNPSAANPLAYPFFPFANPPFAARAYAYYSAAQYDALVSAYHYKSQYKRPTPHQVDASVKELLPVAATYAYPSEAGVVAGAAAEMMKFLFPGEQDYIQQKLTEHKNARIMSGANVRSDFEAGEKLGKLVAAKFVARARTDRAGAAAGNPAERTKCENACIAKGEAPWHSLETPVRMPMLILFGKVKGFLMDSMAVVNGRPVPPPSTNSDEFKKEAAEILDFTENPTRERIRIVHFWADGTGTYTPPGHWNAIAADDWVTQNWSEVRWARNYALLNLAMFDAAICCWDTKMFYYNPRPSETNPKIKTLTGVPNFPAYTSGHSTFSGAAAAFLGHVMPSHASGYDAMAQQASLSRMYGGIHYRSDCEKGLATGRSIGDMAVQRALTDGAE